jgi:4-diphosphocytidyl-2-C-methyl-D-erythritol kinase
MIRLLAPAKLNLYLRVLGLRPDGYHEIETVFERIDLADELTFEPHPSEVGLTCTDPTLSCGEENLIAKAARLLQAASGARLGARIHVVKRIPIAAGLGGGSSDAATTLAGLNELWGLGLAQARLIELAAQLGSDVPCFLSQAALTIGRGRGEVCEPIHPACPLAHVLVIPDVRLSTGESYEAFRQRRRAGSSRPIGRGSSQIGLTGSGPSLTMVTHALSNGSLGELAKGLWNDLAPEAIRRCPVISLIQRQLCEAGCVGSGVSGSGPAVFGLCADGRHAHEVAAAIRRHGQDPWRIEVVQTEPSSLAGSPTNS